MVKNVQELAADPFHPHPGLSTSPPAAVRGPVLIDIPKDGFPGPRSPYSLVDTIHLPGYKVFAEGHAGQIRRAAQLIWEAERPFVYAGGGTVLGKASEELTELVELADLPAVCTLMALGSLSSSHKNFISMPGMHGSYAANMGMTECDLLIALGTRFDDRVTGQLQAFARHARVIHVDIDPAEVGKNRVPDIPIVGDVKLVLQKLNKVVKELEPEFKPKQAAARAQWWTRIREWQAEHPYDRSRAEDEIKPQHLMDEIDRLSGGQAIVTSGSLSVSDAGPRKASSASTNRIFWINSGGLGAMGFGVPSALGALRMARPDKTPSSPYAAMAASRCSYPGTRRTIASHALHRSRSSWMNNEAIILGDGAAMVADALRCAATAIRLSCGQNFDCFPDAEKLAAAYGFKGRTIDKPWQLAEALEEAIKEPGPYLLNVKVTRDENVYPMEVPRRRLPFTKWC